MLFISLKKNERENDGRRNKKRWYCARASVSASSCAFTLQTQQREQFVHVEIVFSCVGCLFLSNRYESGHWCKSLALMLVVVVVVVVVIFVRSGCCYFCIFLSSTVDLELYNTKQEPKRQDRLAAYTHKTHIACGIFSVQRTWHNFRNCLNKRWILSLALVLSLVW